MSDNLKMSRLLIEVLEHNSLVDPSSGLHNRRSLEDELKRIGEGESRHVGVIMIAIDHLKSVNDRFGHGKGDAVIRAQGDILNGNSRKGSEFAARCGGEVFCIIARCANAGSAEHMAGRMNKVIGEYS